jgi:aerobic carbon-monoxide dehydrogenase large subunit
LVEERIKDALQQFWCRGVLPAWSIAAKIRAHTRRSRNERTQGIGQALLEHAVYDPDSGQLLSGSFMDYTMPRAGDVPPFAFSTHNVPSTANPLGVKGAGEAGAVGAPPAVINAIVDALQRRVALRHIDMPATPRRVWEMLNGIH